MTKKIKHNKKTTLIMATHIPHPAHPVPAALAAHAGGRDPHPAHIGGRDPHPTHIGGHAPLALAAAHVPAAHGGRAAHSAHVPAVPGGRDPLALATPAAHVPAAPGGRAAHAPAHPTPDAHAALAAHADAHAAHLVPAAQPQSATQRAMVPRRMKEFLILRYFVSCPFVADSVNVVYGKYYPPEAVKKTRPRDDPRNRILSPHEAQQIIRENKMVKACENKHGVIWRLPEA